MVLTLLTISCSSAIAGYEFKECKPAERLYFDFHDMPRDDDQFNIHVGENVWVQTRAIHKDSTGFFTYASNVCSCPITMEYIKKWKCPYCNRYWPIGEPCGNRDCPSRYK